MDHLRPPPKEMLTWIAPLHFSGSGALYLFPGFFKGSEPLLVESRDGGGRDGWLSKTTIALSGFLKMNLPPSSQPFLVTKFTM